MTTPTVHQNDVEYLVHDRIDDLYTTARELRDTRRDAYAHAGLVLRTRWSIGRRLVSLGNTVSGQHA